MSIILTSEVGACQICELLYCLSFCRRILLSKLHVLFHCQIARFNTDYFQQKCGGVTLTSVIAYRFDRQLHVHTHVHKNYALVENYKYQKHIFFFQI